MAKILLVEDDKSLREIYGVRLLAEGYDIVSAGDGEEALAMAIKERPNLILSDVMMPKISGFDMLDILRSTTETRNIKVIIMTALSSDDQRLRGESLGADMYLVKSQVGIEDVVRAVKEVLARASTQNNHSQINQPPAQAPASNMTAQPTISPNNNSSNPIVNPVNVNANANPAPHLSQQVGNFPNPNPQMSATPNNQTPANFANNLASNQLPRPTAPFSTPRNQIKSTTERIIQPPVRTGAEHYDVARAMAEALSEQTSPTPHLNQNINLAPTAAPAEPHTSAVNNPVQNNNLPNPNQVAYNTPQTTQTTVNHPDAPNVMPAHNQDQQFSVPPNQWPN